MRLLGLVWVLVVVSLVGCSDKDDDDGVVANLDAGSVLDATTAPPDAQTDAARLDGGR